MVRRGPPSDEPDARSSSSELLGNGLSHGSDAWLSRLRGRLRHRLFGSSSPSSPAFADTMNAAGRAEPTDAQVPERIGRYRIVGRIGSGGMGVIYEGWDDALGRKVAVKLLRTEGFEADERGRARLQREAQALARLSHPSVISVYEVGEHAKQVFIAMEFVEGETLRRWQARPDLAWRAVLRAYVAAGRGLAAAHSAGIVHRDFKPDNVLVGRDGQIRVIDFGLARTDLDAGLTPPPSLLPHDRPPDEALTRTGALMGTPAYMAPEQFRGEPAGTHTDQFAFCVALWEALHGFRPFAGATVGQLAKAVLEGRIEAPPRYTDVPDHIHRVLAQGLSVRPEDRFADFERLIDELSADSTRRRRWIRASVSLGLVGTLGVGSWWQLEDDDSDAPTVHELRQRYDLRRRTATEETLARSRDLGEVARYNALILERARALVAADPSGALSTLSELDPRDVGWLDPARLLAARAAQGDIVVHTDDPDVGAIERVWVDDRGSVTVWGARGMARRRAGDERFSAPVEATRVDVAVDAKSRVWVDLDDALWFQGEGEARRVRGARRIEQVAISPDGEWIAAAMPRKVVLWSTAALDAPLSRSVRRPLRNLLFAEEAFVGIDDKGGAWRFPVEVQTTQGFATVEPAGRVLGYDPGTGALDVLDGSGQWEQLHFSPFRLSYVFEGRSFRALARALHTREVAALTAEGRVELWSADLGESRPFAGRADALALSPWARWMVAAHQEKVSVWRLAAPDVDRLGIYDGAVSALDLAPDRGVVAVGTSAGTARLWNVRDDTHEVVGHLIGGIREVSFSPSGRFLAAVGGLGGATVWDVETLQPQTAVSALGPIDSALVWAKDEEALALHACDTPRRCRIVLHSLTRDESIASTPLGPPVRWFAVSPTHDRFLVVRSGANPDVLLHRPGHGDVLTVPWSHRPASVVACRFEETRIWLATSDGLAVILWLWDPDEERILEMERRPAVDVIASQDHETLLLRGARDELWRPGEGLVLPVRGIPEAVERFSTSPDANAALFFGSERATLVHLETGVSRHFGPLGDRVAWSGGTVLADVPSYSLVRLWRDPTPDNPAAFLTWLRTLSDASPG